MLIDTDTFSQIGYEREKTMCNYIQSSSWFFVLHVHSTTYRVWVKQCLLSSLYLSCPCEPFSYVFVVGDIGGIWLNHYHFVQSLSDDMTDSHNAEIVYLPKLASSVHNSSRSLDWMKACMLSVWHMDSKAKPGWVCDRGLTRKVKFATVPPTC